METIFPTLIPTGINGLDVLLGGGLPASRSILVQGGPGTGKTILGTQFIYNGFQLYNEPGIIVSLEESTSNLIENLSGFGWKIRELVDTGKITVIDASPTRASADSPKYTMQVEHPFLSETNFSIESLVSVIHSARRKSNAKRLLIDCITNMMLQYDNVFSARQDIVTLIKSLRKTGLTTILTAEWYPGSPFQSCGVEPFLVDGVITLSLLRHGNSKLRSVEVLKMRGVMHRMDSALVRITNEGIEVYPNEPTFSEETRERIW